jgi:hypothetical protein
VGLAGSNSLSCLTLSLQCFVEPIEDALVADAGALRFTVEVGTVAFGEADELFGRRDEVIETLGLAGPVGFVCGIRNQDGASDLLCDGLEIVGLRGFEGVVVRREAVGADAETQSGFRGRAEALGEEAVELGLFSGMEELLQGFRDVCRPRRENVDDAGIGDRRGNTMFEGDRARNPITALADALEGDALRINFGAIEGVVDDGCDDFSQSGRKKIFCFQRAYPALDRRR